MEKKINVKGMTCNHCKMTIEKVLLGLNGVTDVVVSLEEGNVIVNFDQTKVNLEQMYEIIEEQGYDVLDK